MSVSEPDVIDVVSHDPKTDAVVLSMVEERDWGEEGALLPELQAKLNTYLAYVLDGQLAKDYPQVAGKPVRIRLHYTHAPGDEEKSFLAMIKRDYLKPQKIGWEQARLA